MINRIPVIRCRRLLAGTLFTADGILRQAIITCDGTTLHITPFTGETHSTIHLSRVAVVNDSFPADFTTNSSDIAALGDLLSPHLASLSSPGIDLISLDSSPTLIRFA